MNCLKRSQAIKRLRLWTTVIAVSSCFILFIYIDSVQQSRSDIRDLSQSRIAINLPFQCVLSKLLRGKVLVLNQSINIY